MWSAFSVYFSGHRIVLFQNSNYGWMCVYVYNVWIMIWQYQNLFHVDRRHIWLAHNQYNVFTAFTTRWPIDDPGTSERLVLLINASVWLCNHLLFLLITSLTTWWPIGQQISKTSCYRKCNAQALNILQFICWPSWHNLQQYAICVFLTKWPVNRSKRLSFH